MALVKNYFFTSESVTEGHPDKIADQISDAVLDAIIAKDKTARVACETLVTTGLAFVAGEITTNCYVEIPDIVRETIRRIGYTRAKYGFVYETCAVITSIHEQSSDIALGVLGLLLAADAIHVGITAPARRGRDAARERFAAAREERERLRTETARLERRGTRPLAPEGDAAAARALRLSLLRATERLSLAAVQIAEAASQSAATAQPVRLAPLAEVLR